MSWKLWAWQRVQQLIGALAVIIPTVLFVWFLADSPTLDRILPQRDQNVSLGNLDDPRLDHIHIATAIGSCHLRASPVTWPTPWQAVLKVFPYELLSTGDATNSVNPSPTKPTDAVSSQEEYTLTPFERAAIYHSDRLSHERRAFAADADNRQLRLRSNQTRILFVSAAAAFLVGLRALVASKDTDLPFRSLTQGSLLPISALVLLVPVIGTALSGLVAFDDDATAAIRDTRAVSQLEQLHGRIAEDVISDPYLCPVVEATRLAAAGSAGSVDRANIDACLFDRFQRTTAWEQRHEQILNDASQTLAHAGDLPKPAGPSSNPADATGASSGNASSSGDKCQEAFRPTQARRASTELATPPAHAQASPASSRERPL